MNDTYCKDISVKIRSNLDVKRRKGEYVGSFTPYGYKKNPDNRSRLIVDEPAADIVKKIFSMYKDGTSMGQIAEYLNGTGVASPMEYKNSTGIHFRSVFRTNHEAKWSYRAVKRILTNEAYTGILAQGKRGTPNYKVHILQEKDKSEWITVQDAHEAIITQEDFTSVQNLIGRDTRSSGSDSQDNVLSGFVFCGDCGQPMTRRTVERNGKQYYYYVCSTHKRHEGCSMHNISVNTVEKAAVSAISSQVSHVLDLSETLDYIQSLPVSERKALTYENRIEKLEKEIERCRRMKLSNPAYIGSRVYGIRHSAIYKGIKIEKRPEEDWYVTENAHEPLISRELYDSVKEKLRKNSLKLQESKKRTAKARAGIIDLFDKKTVCADCGYRMYFHRHQMDCKDRHWIAEYYCSSGQKRKYLGCSYHGIKKEVLDEKVFHAIKAHIDVALNYEEMITKLKGSKTAGGIRNRMNNRIKSLSLKVSAIQEKRTRLYEDYVSGALNDDEYLYARSKYEADYEKINNCLETAVKEKAGFDETISSENKWIRLMKSARGCRKLTKELADNLVEQVRIHEKHVVEIIFMYQDVFDLTREYMDQIRAKEGESIG